MIKYALGLVCAIALLIPANATAKTRYCGNMLGFEQVTSVRVKCTWVRGFIKRANFHMNAPDEGAYTPQRGWYCDLFYYGDEGAVEWVCQKRKRQIAFLDVTYLIPADNRQPDPAQN